MMDTCSRCSPLTRCCHPTRLPAQSASTHQTSNPQTSILLHHLGLASAHCDQDSIVHTMLISPLVAIWRTAPCSVPSPSFFVLSLTPVQKTCRTEVRQRDLTRPLGQVSHSLCDRPRGSQLWCYSPVLQCTTTQHCPIRRVSRYDAQSDISSCLVH